MDTNPNKPLVSVVLATYNGERFLQEQLDSIIRQTYENIEIIAIDDCSTDDTVAILNQYAANYSNFTVYKNEQNLGYIKNFEKGFSLANGHYIAPCDQDDRWLPRKIEVLLNNIGEHAIVYCNSEFINSTGQLIGKKMSETKTLTDFNSPLMYIEVGTSALGHAMLITKQIALAAMPFSKLFSHDNWLGFVATFNSSVKFIDEVLVQYRRHDANLTNALLKKDRKRISGKKSTKQQRIVNAQQRLKTMYDKCPDRLPEKEIIYQLYKSHESYSLRNNFFRMYLFFQHYRKILLHKKYHHSELRCWLHCMKVFYKTI